MQFEWDPEEAASNLAKHGVSFEEASTVLAMHWQPPFWIRIIRRTKSAFSQPASRTSKRVVIVWHTEQDKVRIIGAREATPRERRVYESGE